MRWLTSLTCWMVRQTVVRPLHRDMDPETWRRDFGAAFEDLKRRINAGDTTVMDEYASHGPR